MCVNGWRQQPRPASATSEPPFHRGETTSHSHPRMDGEAQVWQAPRRSLFPCARRATTSVALPEPGSWRGCHRQHPEEGGDKPQGQHMGREPQGSWATQSRENRHRQKEESQGEEGVHTKDPHRPRRTTGGLRPQGPTNGSAGPQGALASGVGSTPPSTPLTRTTRLWARRGAGSTVQHPFSAGRETSSPRSHALAVPGN